MERTPSLLIVSLEDDLHAHVVEADLLARGTVAVARVADDVISAAPGAVSFTMDGSALVATNGDIVSPADFDAVWWRRSGNHQYLGQNDFSAAEREVIDNDCAAAMIGALLGDFRGRWISHPEATRSAENKARQLRVAQSVGLRIPRTIITSDPDAIARFAADNPAGVIVKPVRGTHRVPLQTQVLTPGHLANRAGLGLAPAIYQELIPGSEHLRVTVFGDDIVAVLMTSDDLDWRPHPDILIRPTRLEPGLSAQLLRVLELLDLRMGVFDLKIDERSAEPVWFEVNPQGQYLFVEGLSGVDLRGPAARFFESETLAAHRDRRERTAPGLLQR